MAAPERHRAERHASKRALAIVIGAIASVVAIGAVALAVIAPLAFRSVGDAPETTFPIKRAPNPPPLAVDAGPE
jgi:hypothetical protein